MQAAPADAPAAAADRAAAAAALAVCNPFWLPDPNDPDAVQPLQQGWHTVVGHYVISAMDSPQKDPSVQPDYLVHRQSSQVGVQKVWS
jgi:hypothetical protein